jgi:hypothetical protein
LDQTGIEITNVLCKDLVELAVNTADELSGEVCSFLGIKPCIDMSC